MGLFASSFLLLYFSWSKFMTGALMSLHFRIVLPGHLGICYGNLGVICMSWTGAGKFVVFFMTGAIEVWLLEKIERVVWMEGNSGSCQNSIDQAHKTWESSRTN